MSKRGKLPKFGRERDQRTALYKSLATALIDHGRIKTTRTKAKTISSYVDKLVTKAKKNDITARRRLTTDLGPKAVTKLMADIAPKFQGRQGGYTRVIPMPRRASDGSPMAIVEFTA